MKMLLIVLMVASVQVQAREVAFKRDVMIDEVEATLRAQGFQVLHTECSGDWNCRMVLPDSEKKDPLPIINAARSNAAVKIEAAADRRAMLEELLVIEEAVDAGTETEAQRRRFMKILLKLIGFSRRP